MRQRHLHWLFFGAGLVMAVLSYLHWRELGFPAPGRGTAEGQAAANTVLLLAIGALATVYGVLRLWFRR